MKRQQALQLYYEFNGIAASTESVCYEVYAKICAARILWGAHWDFSDNEIATGIAEEKAS